MLTHPDHHHHHYFRMDTLTEALGKLGLIMSSLLSINTAIDPTWLNLALTAAVAVPTAIFFIHRAINERKKGKLLDLEIELKQKELNF